VGVEVSEVAVESVVLLVVPQWWESLVETG
jgi:hypothetical protein